MEPLSNPPIQDEAATAYEIAALLNQPSDESREKACKDAFWGYKYALDVDRCPRDDTRAAATLQPKTAYHYALHVDKAPRDDTRQAASRDGLHSLMYAVNVDRHPHPVTRAGAEDDPETKYRRRYQELEAEGPGKHWIFEPRIAESGYRVRSNRAQSIWNSRFTWTKPNDADRKRAAGDPSSAWYYAQHVDKGPHPVTRKGACKDAWWAARYAAEIDHHPTPETMAAVKGSRWEDETNGGPEYYGVLEPKVEESVPDSRCWQLLEAMYDTPPARPPAIVQKIPISRADLEIVAACLIGEAGGEGAKGMQAVMNVIANRAGGQAGQFKTVVLAPKQFSAMNLATGRRPKTTVTKLVAQHKHHPLWQQALMIAHQASYRQLPDLTRGSTHYHTTAVKPTWAKTLKPVGYLGAHVFYTDKKP